MAKTAGMRKFTQDQMPSKKYNGNAPLGSTRLQGSGSLADAELEIAKRTPKQSMTTGLIQTPSGAIHAPKRTRRVTAGTSSPWSIRLTQDTETELWYITVGTGKVWDQYNGIDETLVLEPNAGDYSNQTGVVDFPINDDTKVQVVANDYICLQAKFEGDTIFRKVTSLELEDTIQNGTTYKEGFYVLGKIVVNPEDSELLVKTQKAESNLFRAGYCDSGHYVTGLHAV